MIQRMMGAALFNAQTYEEIEADQSAIGQAIGVVMLVTLCGIVGGVIGGLLGEVSISKLILGVVGGVVFGSIRWALWVTVATIIGGKLLRTSNTQTSWQEMGRVIGFAYTPGILAVLNFIPVIGPLFYLVGFCWTLAAVTVAIRQALDFESTGRAIVVVLITGVIGFIPWLIVWGIELKLLGWQDVANAEPATSAVLSFLGLI